jgi:hypothetical protein
LHLPLAVTVRLRVPEHFRRLHRTARQQFNQELPGVAAVALVVSFGLL